MEPKRNKPKYSFHLMSEFTLLRKENLGKTRRLLISKKFQKKLYWDRDFRGDSCRVKVSNQRRLDLFPQIWNGRRKGKGKGKGKGKEGKNPSTSSSSFLIQNSIPTFRATNRLSDLNEIVSSTFLQSQIE